MQAESSPKISQLMHFKVEIPMPPEATISAYKPHHTTTKLKKNKHKFDEFTYYRVDGDRIIKVLFKDDEHYQLQGEYPFTDPQIKMETTLELNKLNAKRIVKTEAAYIGHYEDKVVFKKLHGVKLGNDGNEFETVDDHF